MRRDLCDTLIEGCHVPSRPDASAGVPDTSVTSPKTLGFPQKTERISTTAVNLAGESPDLPEYDPEADSIGSYYACIQEIGRRVKAGEEPVPTTGYFGRRRP